MVGPVELHFDFGDVLIDFFGFAILKLHEREPTERIESGANPFEILGLASLFESLVYDPLRFAVVALRHSLGCLITVLLPAH